MDHPVGAVPEPEERSGIDDIVVPKGPGVHRAAGRDLGGEALGQEALSAENGFGTGVRIACAVFHGLLRLSQEADADLPAVDEEGRQEDIEKEDKGQDI